MAKMKQDLSQIKVLVVDDDETMRDFMVRITKRLGFAVDMAEDGEKAFELLRENNYLIVVTDIEMPAMNGIELLAKIKKLSPPTHVIIVTGYVTRENILTVMRKGADTCILKPLKSPERLEQALLRAAQMTQEWRDILVKMMKMEHESFEEIYARNESIPS